MSIVPHSVFWTILSVHAVHCLFHTSQCEHAKQLRFGHLSDSFYYYKQKIFHLIYFAVSGIKPSLPCFSPVFLYFPSADPLLLCLNPPSFYPLFLPPLSGFHLHLTDSLGLNCDSPLSPLLFLLPSSSLYSSSSSSGSGGPSPGTAPWCEG